MSDALVILNPRRIPDVIRAVEALEIEKCWLSNMTEIHAAEHFNALVRHTDYARYLILSDDAIPSPLALRRVLELHDDGHAVATGYCNLDSEMPEVNLARNELPPPPPGVNSYDLMTQREVDDTDGVIQTTFAGFSLTCMTREMWLRYPMAATTSGGQMDYSLSYRLQQDGHAIVSHRDARLVHLKERWNQRDSAIEKQLLVGVLPPEIRWSA